VYTDSETERENGNFPSKGTHDEIESASDIHWPMRGGLQVLREVPERNIVMMMTYGDSPLAEQTPPDWRKKILHATLDLGDNVMTGADAPPEHYRQPQGFSVPPKRKAIRWWGGVQTAA
jgi:hypothetical protein